MINPWVSIITPVLNGKKYISDCLNSILNQTYPFIEHILIDGKSVDGTLEIIQEFVSRYPEKIKLFLQTNDGIGEAWNQGIDNSRGQILGWLGADDVYQKGAVELVVDFFHKNPEAYFVYGGQNFIDEHGKVIISCPPEPFDYDVLLNKKQMIHTTSAFFKRQTIDAVGKLDSMGNDYDFYLRVGKKFSIYSINSILSNFRIHDNSQTSGASIEKRKKWLKAWCQTCLHHGGSRLSTYCLKYYIFSLFSWALPIWNFIYFQTLKTFKRKIF